MSRLPPNELLITADDVRKTTKLLPRLIHNLMYSLGITYGRYQDYYMEYAARLWPEEQKSKIHPKLGANRQAVKEKRSATYQLFETEMKILKKDIIRITVEYRDQTTGEIGVVTTTDTVEEMDAKLKSEHSFGIDSL